jgi:hypothetical protein
MKTVAALLSLLLVAACMPMPGGVDGRGTPAPILAGGHGADYSHPLQARGVHDPMRVQIWVDGNRDLLQRGDRVRLNLRTTRDAYVAVIHVDTDGVLDFVHPYNPWESHHLRGGRVHQLAPGRAAGTWTVRGNPGIGYFYVIASPVPLDFRGFQQPVGSRWDFSRMGRMVRGDPFLALDAITEMLVPRGMMRSVAVDVYSYHVGSRYPYPSYACYDPMIGPRGGGMGWYYTSCNRLDYLVGRHPYYYDTHRFRGDRRVYVRDLARVIPAHEFKEPGRAAGQPTPVPPGQARPTQPAGTRPVAPTTGQQPQRPQQARPQAPQQTRPQPETRPRPQAEETRPQPRQRPQAEEARRQTRQRPRLERRPPPQQREERGRPAPPPSTRSSGESGSGSGEARPRPTRTRPAPPARERGNRGNDEEASLATEMPQE